MTVDKEIGSFILKIEELIKLGEVEGGTFFWQEILGAPKGFDGEKVRKMNKHPKLASAWMGEVLLHVECVKTD